MHDDEENDRGCTDEMDGARALPPAEDVEKRGEGRRAIRAAFVELEAAGYMHRIRERDRRGRYVTTVWVTDVPTVYRGPKAA